MDDHDQDTDLQQLLDAMQRATPGKRRQVSQPTSSSSSTDYQLGDWSSMPFGVESSAAEAKSLTAEEQHDATVLTGEPSDVHFEDAEEHSEHSVSFQSHTQYDADASHVQVEDPEVLAAAAKLDEALAAVRACALKSLVATKLRVMEDAANLREHDVSEAAQRQQSLHGTISNVQQQLAFMHDHAARLQLLLERAVSVIPQLKEQERVAYSSKWSMLHLFAAWRDHTRRMRQRRSTAETAGKLRRQKLLKQTWCTWRTHARLSRRAAVDNFWESKLDETSSQLIAGARSRIVELEKAKAQAEAHAQQSIRRAHAMEEQLKTVFLRGVSSMNLEAAQLFRQTADASLNLTVSAVPPPEAPSSRRSSIQSEAVNRSLISTQTSSILLPSEATPEPQPHPVPVPLPMPSVPVAPRAAVRQQPSAPATAVVRSKVPMPAQSAVPALNTRAYKALKAGTVPSTVPASGPAARRAPAPAPAPAPAQAQAPPSSASHASSTRLSADPLLSSSILTDDDEQLVAGTGVDEYAIGPWQVESGVWTEPSGRRS